MAAQCAAVQLALPCLALPISPSSWLRVGGHWHGHQGSPRASVQCPLRAEHTLRRIFQSTAWYRQSSVSVVFLGVFFRQRCHVERACRDYPLEPHGRRTVVFSSWLLPGSDVPVPTLLILPLAHTNQLSCHFQDFRSPLFSSLYSYEQRHRKSSVTLTSRSSGTTRPFLGPVSLLSDVADRWFDLDIDAV